MPLPDAEPKPKKANIYEQFSSIKIADFTRDQLDIVRDPLFLNSESEDVLRRIKLIGEVSNQLSLSGVIPGSIKTISITTTSSGSYVTLFRPDPGEVYQVMSAHMAKVGSGTTVHSISYYDGSTDSQWFYLSTGSTDNILTSDDNWPTHSLFLDNANYFRYKATNNFTSSTIQLVVARVR